MIHRLEVRGAIEKAIKAFSDKVLLLKICSKEAKRATNNDWVLATLAMNQFKQIC